MGGAKDAHIYGESDGHRCRRCHKLLPPIPPLHRETFLLPAKEWRNQSLSNPHYNVILLVGMLGLGPPGGSPPGSAIHNRCVMHTYPYAKPHPAALTRGRPSRAFVVSSRLCGMRGFPRCIPSRTPPPLRLPLRGLPSNLQFARCLHSLNSLLTAVSHFW